MCVSASALSNMRVQRTYLSCVRESADVIVLMMIMMMVFIYLPRWKKVDRGLNERSVRGRREQSASQEERGSGEDGVWGRGVNSSLCGEREKRESLLWYVYMSM